MVRLSPPSLREPSQFVLPSGQVRAWSSWSQALLALRLRDEEGVPRRDVGILKKDEWAGRGESKAA